MTLNTLLPYLFLILTCFTCITVARESIVNGEVAAKRQFPYQVAVFFENYGFKCGGGILADKYVLTAAHCLTDSTILGRRVFVHAGTISLHTKDHVVEVDKYFVPVDYKRTSILNDIAVLKLKLPLGLAHYHNLGHLNLPRPRESFIGKIAKISGWGWHWVNVHGVSEEGGVHDWHLRFSNAVVISNNECSHVNDGLHFTEKHLCARIVQTDHHKPRGVCVGDSGSPLVVEGKTVIAILSRSPRGCNEEAKAAIYTDVSRYLEFIHEAMNSE